MMHNRLSGNSALASPMSLNDKFFQKPTLELARSLLGMKLWTKDRERVTSGMIVEVEAYRGDIDEASHSYGGPSERTRVMFGPPGHAYVYFIYGMHHCINVSSEKEGVGAGILIRALEPLDGVEIMKRRRHVKDEKNLTNGPGKLCQALGIDDRLLGCNFTTSLKIRLEPYKTFSDSEISTSKRIGISKARDLEWRFFVKGNRYVSKFKS
jgi:DNA-3-methyladenine glycosylase